MGEQFFDDLARGLDDGTISRRRALRLAGGALLAAVVPSVFSREAEALSARKRCHRKRGLDVLAILVFTLEAEVHPAVGVSGWGSAGVCSRIL